MRDFRETHLPSKIKEVNELMWIGLTKETAFELNNTIEIIFLSRTWK